MPKSWYDVVNSRFAGDVEAEEMANVVNMMRHIEYAVCAQKKPILVVVEVFAPRRVPRQMRERCILYVSGDWRRTDQPSGEWEPRT